MFDLLKRLFRSEAASELSTPLNREMPLLARLRPEELQRLQRLAAGFLRHKSIDGAGGLEVSDPMRNLVALQACLPILELGLDFYRGWHSIILYPDEFRAPFEFADPAGVVHQGSRELSGEAWHRGPVILAWSHVEHDAQEPGSAANVVIHEMAHKLDLLNGDANGMPPLHREMDPRRWFVAMSAAYDDLTWYVERDAEPPIEPYAAQSPGEFFAVVSELFFAWPEILLEPYPEVYRQLGLYYRQDPASASSRAWGSTP